jgi:hypothetical protein
MTARIEPLAGRAPRRLAPGWRIALRIVAAVPAGYALSALGVSALGAALTAAGLARADAVIVASMLGFVFYLLWLLWAFAVRSLSRLYAVLLCAATLALGVHWLAGG